MNFQRYLPIKKLEMSRKLLSCCQHNKVEEVRDCLSRGVDVNTVSEFGYWSGLTIAADRNYLELLEIFLSHPDIKINNTTKSGVSQSGVSQWTALMFACHSGNSAIVSRLVQVPGLDLN